MNQTLIDKINESIAQLETKIGNGFLAETTNLALITLKKEYINMLVYLELADLNSK